MASCPCCRHLTVLNAELRSQIDDLRYLLYWKDRNTDKLARMILRFNMGTPYLKCDCHWCIIAGYYDGDLFSDDLSKKCRLRQKLREIITECGMTALQQGNNQGIKHCSNEQEHVFDLDCHFVFPKGQDGIVTYGAKVWKAELDSEELRKLDHLFEVLDPFHA